MQTPERSSCCICWLSEGQHWWHFRDTLMTMVAYLWLASVSTSAFFPNRRSKKIHSYS
uniref:Uncharacterized protein n=1 Tax=Anopheles atroparvus TaxID=41427 RepID=A0AAG5DM77_ANOAO